MFDISIAELIIIFPPALASIGIFFGETKIISTKKIINNSVNEMSNMINF